MVDSKSKLTPDPFDPEVAGSQSPGQVAAPKTGDNPKDVDDALRATFTDMEGATIDVPDDLPSLQPDMVEAWVNKFKIPCRDNVQLSNANTSGRGGRDFLYFQKDGKKFKIFVSSVKFDGVEFGDKDKGGSKMRNQLIEVMESRGYFCTTFEEVDGSDGLKRLLKEKSEPAREKEISGIGFYKLALSSLKEGEAVLWHYRGALGAVFFVKGNEIFKLPLVNLRMDGKYLDREELAELLKDAGFKFIENPVINDPRWQLPR